MSTEEEIIELWETYNGCEKEEPQVDFDLLKITIGKVSRGELSDYERDRSVVEEENDEEKLIRTQSK